MKIYYIYACLCIITGKIYIGYSINPKHRWQCHCVTQDNKPFYNAIRKYGRECFEHYILACSINLKEIKQKEIRFIKQFNTQVPNGYNLTAGGEGSLKIKVSKETRKKITESLMGNKRAQGIKHSIDAKTRNKSKEHRRKISKAKKGIKCSSVSESNKNRKGEIRPKGRIRSKKDILKQRITCLKNKLKKVEQNAIQ